MVRIDGMGIKAEDMGDVTPGLRGGEIMRIGAATGANAMDVSRVKR